MNFLHSVTLFFIFKLRCSLYTQWSAPILSAWNHEVSRFINQLKTQMCNISKIQNISNITEGRHMCLHRSYFPKAITVSISIIIDYCFRILCEGNFSIWSLASDLWIIKILLRFINVIKYITFLARIFLNLKHCSHSVFILVLIYLGPSSCYIPWRSCFHLKLIVCHSFLSIPVYFSILTPREQI